ncbi:MAG: Gfo/Idh/MocA family oxidoreductase [Bacteroidota bacterium]
MKRRTFLSQAGLAAAAFTIVPRHVIGKGYRAPSDTLYVAGIGAGGKGKSDIAAFAKSGKATIAYLCDVDDRQAADSRAAFPQAKYFKDYRELLDKESKSFDAVSVSTPDHMHAIQALSAMELGKHVYVQKPLTHDIFEARQLTEAASKYKVVTQMGNQGASNEGVRLMREWYDAGLIGEAHTVYCWTNRPIWPQGIAWPQASNEIPKELDWNLWLGTAPQKNYVDNLVPFNWRGWWDYGTGALGDMALHIIEPAFRVLQLGYPTSVEASVGTQYLPGIGKRAYYPESCPPSSHIILTFPKKGKNVKFHWMDGGIQPERPDELGPNEIMGDGGNGVIIVGTKGKMMCDTYSNNPRLLPTSKTKEVTAKVKQTIARVPGGAEGHYGQWVEACLAGYGKKEVSSPFELAGPLTESVLMGNLALRSYDIRKPGEKEGQFTYPGRFIKLLWDGPNMKITNFEDANQFVKREYRKF